MKNFMRGLILLIVSVCQLQAQFVDFKDSTSKNRFLGVDIGMCGITANNSKNDYQKAYDCKNNTISGLLNLNFLSPELLGQQFYIFNNFIYWMSSHDGMGAWNGSEEKVAKKQAQADANSDQNFSGTGVFMISLGTSSYLQKIVAPDTTCPAGKTLLVAQLKYNDGNSLTAWSQDSLCIAPTDTFEIAVSKDQDNSVPPGIPATDVDGQGVDWMKDNGPAANYAKAGDSPRKVRLVLKSGGAQAEQAAPVALSTLKPTISNGPLKAMVPGAAAAAVG